jgi:hypothetical protein
MSELRGSRRSLLQVRFGFQSFIKIALNIQLTAQIMSVVSGGCASDDGTVASDDCIRDIYRRSGCDGSGTFVAQDPFFSTRSGWALDPALKRDATRGMPNATQMDVWQTMNLWNWYRRVSPGHALAQRCSTAPFWPRLPEKADTNSRPAGEDFKVREPSNTGPYTYASEPAAITACQTAPDRGMYAPGNPAGLIGWAALHDPLRQQGFCSSVWRTADNRAQALSDPNLSIHTGRFPDRYSFFPKTCWDGTHEPCDYVINLRGAWANLSGANLNWQAGTYDGNSYLPGGAGWTAAKTACSNDPNCAGVWREWANFAAVPKYKQRLTSATELATGNERFTQPYENLGGSGMPNPSLFGTVPANYAFPTTAGIAGASVFSTNLPTSVLLPGDATQKYNVARDAQTAASAAARTAEQAVITATSAFAAAVVAKDYNAADVAAKQADLQTKIIAARSAAAAESAAIATTTALLSNWQATTTAVLSVQAGLGSAGVGDCQWWAPQSGVQPAVTGGESYPDAAAAGKACVAGGPNCTGVWQADTGGSFFVVKTTAAPGDYLHPMVAGKGIFWRKSCPTAEIGAAEALIASKVSAQKAIDDAALKTALADQSAAAAVTASQVKQLADDALAAANATAKGLQEKLNAANTQTAQTTKDMLVLQDNNARLSAQYEQMKALAETLTTARDSAVQSRDAALKQLNAGSSCSIM